MSIPIQDTSSITSISYSSYAPVSIPPQCAYTTNVILYWVGVAVVIVLSLIALGFITFIFNPGPGGYGPFTGYHPGIIR